MGFSFGQALLDDDDKKKKQESFAMELFGDEIAEAEAKYQNKQVNIKRADASRNMDEATIKKPQKRKLGLDIRGIGESIVKRFGGEKAKDIQSDRKPVEPIRAGFLLKAIDEKEQKKVAEAKNAWRDTFLDIEQAKKDLEGEIISMQIQGDTYVTRMPVIKRSGEIMRQEASIASQGQPLRDMGKPLTLKEETKNLEKKVSLMGGKDQLENQGAVKKGTFEGDEATTQRQAELLQESKESLQLLKEYSGEVEAKGGFLSGITSAMKDDRDAAKTFIPFAGDIFSTLEIVHDAKEIKKVQDKLANGEDLTIAEKTFYKRYQNELLSQMIKRGVAYDIGKTIASLPKYALEFAITGGIATGITKGLGRVGAKSALTKTLETASKEGVKKTIGSVTRREAKEIGVDLVRSSIANAGRTGIGFSPTISRKTAEYMSDDMAVVQGENGDMIVKKVGEGDSFWKALTKAYATTYVEVGAESTGLFAEVPMASAKRSVMNVLGKHVAEPDKFLQKAILAKFATKRGIVSTEQLSKVAEKIGWNGVVAEVFEEELTELAQAPIEERTYYPIWTPQGLERFFVETMAIGAFGGLGAIAKAPLPTGRIDTTGGRREEEGADTTEKPVDTDMVFGLEKEGIEIKDKGQEQTIEQLDEGNTTVEEQVLPQESVTEDTQEAEPTRDELNEVLKPATEQDPLIEEAKKYKSAEEFVEAQQKKYVGTSTKIDMLEDIEVEDSYGRVFGDIDSINKEIEDLNYKKSSYTDEDFAENGKEVDDVFYDSYEDFYEDVDADIRDMEGLLADYVDKQRKIEDEAIWEWVDKNGEWLGNKRGVIADAIDENRRTGGTAWRALIEATSIEDARDMLGRLEVSSKRHSRTNYDNISKSGMGEDEVSKLRGEFNADLYDGELDPVMETERLAEIWIRANTQGASGSKREKAPSLSGSPSMQPQQIKSVGGREFSSTMKKTSLGRNKRILQQDGREVKPILKTNKENAKKYESAEEFLKDVEIVRQEQGKAFTSEKTDIPAELEALASTFGSIGSVGKYAKMYEDGASDTQVLTQLYNDVKGESAKTQPVNTTLQPIVSIAKPTSKTSKARPSESQIAQVFQELDASEAGERFRTTEGDWIGKNSTFPDWITSPDLRDRGVIDKVLGYLRSGKEPPERFGKIRALYDMALEEAQTREADVEADKEIEQDKKDAIKKKKANEIKVGDVSTSKDRKIATTKPIEAKGKIRESRAFQNVKERLQDATEDDPTYNQMDLADNAVKAVEFVRKYPKRAEKISMGMELPPSGMTQTAITLAYSEALGLTGKHAKRVQVEKVLSLTMTRLGQEIVSLRGRINTDSSPYFIQKVLEARKNLLASGWKLPSYVQKIGGKPIETNAKKVAIKISEDAKNLKSKIDAKVLEDLGSAQAFIDSITC